VILAWPLLLLTAGVLCWRRRHLAGERGWFWFVVWTLAGFLMSFSLITGFSIGLLIVPFAGALLLWVARRAPHLPETAGFAVGIVLTAVLIVALNA
jgi:hypothetical protein